MPIDLRDLRRLAARQHGAVSRTQLLDLGATPSWVSRQVDGERWLRVLPGVFVLHTGEPAWSTRAAAALLYAGAGAALSHDSAAFRHGFVSTAPTSIDVSVDHSRRVTGQPGLVVHRRRVLPPAGGVLRSIDAPHTLLDLVAQARSVDDVVGLVCRAVRAGTAPGDVLAALAARARVPHRRVIAEILAEVVAGAESPLERRYQRDVQRRHGLPASTLQNRERVDGRWIRADALYEDLGVRVELDGALAHPGGRTDADTWRDNAVLIERGDLTLRYRWHHVAVQPCETANQVAAALRSRGWAGQVYACGPGCAVGRAES